MFLKQLSGRNPALIDFALAAHGAGALLPDTYLLDVDAISQNAAHMAEVAGQHGISLYFMLKQIGRNPAIARRLMALGFRGAVCVDVRDALVMMAHGIPIGHVGHLVQPPAALVEGLVAYGVEVMTVYSVEKAAEIARAARKLGRVQDIMLRVLGGDDHLYPGQVGGFPLEELARVYPALAALDGIRVAGVCNFPCLQYDPASGEIRPTANSATVVEAAARLRALGAEIWQINLPSATCCASIPTIAALGGTHGEPGHGLTGTTPYHARGEAGVERPAIAYLSEVSHVYDGTSYCYGGGRYSRGSLQHALVGHSPAKMVQAAAPGAESIDYHFALQGIHPVSAPVVLCFRTQIFVTRSEVALVEGLSAGAPAITGIYSAQGALLREGGVV